MCLTDHFSEQCACKLCLLFARIAEVCQAECTHICFGLANKVSLISASLPISVRVAAPVIAGPLHHIVTLSIMQQRFPGSWKCAKVLPLHKKLDPLHKKNYRPVAILSPLSKVLEKFVYEQLYSYFTANKILHPNLHGYRKNRSTQTAL